MMAYRLQYRGEEHYDRAFKQLLGWGYPWPVDEYINIIMIEVHPSAAWIWFELINETQAVIHMGANPEHRGRWFNRHVLRGMYYAAELIGVQRIYTIAEEGQDVINYVKRLGWKHNDIGWYYDV